MEQSSQLSKNKFFPAGSYQLTCRDLIVTLNAECLNRDKKWVKSEPLTLRAAQLETVADIANVDGKLQTLAEGEAADRFGKFVPAGSYQLSSRKITVTIEAEGQLMGEVWMPIQPFTFTAEHAKFMNDIATVNGELEFFMDIDQYVPAGNFELISRKVSPRSSKGYMSAGTYQLTSGNISVIINAECRRFSEGTYSAA